MTVVAFVVTAEDALPVVTWAGRFAASRNAELVVFYVPTSTNLEAVALDALGEEAFQDETHAAVRDAVENVVRTRQSRRSRLPRHAISVRRVSASDQVADLVSRVRRESPDLFVSSIFESSGTNGGKSVPQQVVSKLSCNSILLTGNRRTLKNGKQIIVGASEGNHDDSALVLAAETSKAMAQGAMVVAVEASVGEEAAQVAERHLRSKLRELNLQESRKLHVKATISEDWAAAIADESKHGDLLLIGANMERKVPALLAAAPKATVGLFRRAPRLVFGRGHQYQPHKLLPRLNPADYADLYEMLQAGSRWNADFIVMLSLASGIATLGLLQSSPAVVIGSMLLAPLMTPMIGLGLALNQGNAKLSYSCFRSIGRGFLAALFISGVLALITPGSDLTPEVLARTEPNILDLLIAVFSAAAAAYALARPSLAGTIAGVAIATALVPPVCSAGISFAYGYPHEAVGALSLLTTNVLAIILAAAGTFRAMGLGALMAEIPRRFWVRHVVAGLCLCMLLISIPLSKAFMQQIREGKNAPIAFALTNEVREMLLDHVDALEGVEIIYAGRSGVHRDSHPVDIGVILSAKEPLPRWQADRVVQLLREALQNQELNVRVECVTSGWVQGADEQIGADDEAVADGG